MYQPSASNQAAPSPTQAQRLSGVWLPIVTPFLHNRLDERSVQSMMAHYRGRGLSGLVVAGTTGEAMALSEAETERMVHAVQDGNEERLPVYLGLCGSCTSSMVERMRRTAAWPVDGYLVTAPYYVRPTQQGLVAHYSALAHSTTRPIVLYNIPYRTAVNVENATAFRLARQANIVAIKDCCANPVQSAELMARRPQDFSVLVGDDNRFFDYARQGADGGILASAHLNTEAYVQTLAQLRNGDLARAEQTWATISPMIGLLFAEPNPGPAKYCLQQMGILRSAEVRRPLMPISRGLRGRLDRALEA